MVSNKWLEEQHKIITDKQVLKLDVIDTHYSNVLAYPILYNANSDLSNESVIKDITAYMSPSKNLLYPSLNDMKSDNNGYYFYYNNFGKMYYDFSTSIFHFKGRAYVGKERSLGGIFNRIKQLGLTYSISVELLSMGEVTYEGTINFYINNSVYASIDGATGTVTYNSTVINHDVPPTIDIELDSPETVDNLDFSFRVQLEYGLEQTSYVPSTNLSQGYTGNLASDDNGVLEDTTNLDITFNNSETKLSGISIEWSENLGYAIEYNINYNGKLYEFYNNNKKRVFVVINDYNKNNEIKITVKKWSRPNYPVTIERVFLGFWLTYGEDKILDFKCTESNSVYGTELPQRQITFDLDNNNNEFSILGWSSYTKYLDSKTEIRVSCGYKYPRYTEYITKGVYYLTDWKVIDLDHKATFTAKDIFCLLDVPQIYSYLDGDTLSNTVDKILTYQYNDLSNPNKLYLPINANGEPKWRTINNLLYPDNLEMNSTSVVLYNQNGIFINYNASTGEIHISGKTGSKPLSTGDLMSCLLNGKGYVYYKWINYINTSRLDLVGLMTNGTTTINALETTKKEQYLPFDVSEGTYGFQLFLSADTTYDIGFVIDVRLQEYKDIYRVPVPNAIVSPVLVKENKRNILELYAQSIGCFLDLDNYGNIIFSRNMESMEQYELDRKNLNTEPQFELEPPVQSIAVNYYHVGKDDDYSTVFDTTVTNGEKVTLFSDNLYAGFSYESSKVTPINLISNNWLACYFEAQGTGKITIKRVNMPLTYQAIYKNYDKVGNSLELYNELVISKESAQLILDRLDEELKNDKTVTLDLLRFDPYIQLGMPIRFTFTVGNLTQYAYMRVDNLELNFAGAYSGNISGKILYNFKGDLTPGTYVRYSGDFNAGEENLKWNLIK